MEEKLRYLDLREKGIAFEVIVHSPKEKKLGWFVDIAAVHPAHTAFGCYVQCLREVREILAAEAAALIWEDEIREELAE